MADQLQLRGGTTTEHNTFTGASKEVTIDTTKKTAVVHDGSTAGGNPLLREDGSNSALALGSQGTPSLKFTGDANTGIYSPGADQVAISTNGTGRLFVDANGKVGVGTSPSYHLEVNAGTADTVASFNSSDTNAWIQIRDNTTTDTAVMVGAVGNDMRLRAGSNERLRITSTGEFEFVGAGSAGTTQAVYFSGSAPVNSLVVDSNGRLGIGVSVPNTPLHIEGAKGTAQLTIGNTSLAASDGDFLAGIDFHIKDNNDATGAVCTSIRSIADQNHTLIAKGTALAFSTTPDDTTTLTERLRIDQAGRVGIGSTSPSVLLHVQDNNLTSTTPGENIVARFQTNGNGRDASILLGDTTNTASRIGQTSGNITFHPGSATERARIDSSGRLLVGTTSSRTTFGGNTAGLIQIENNAEGYETSLSLTHNQGTGTNIYLRAPIISLSRTRGTTLGSNTIVQSGDALGYITFEGADGTNVERAAEIKAEVDGTPGTNDMPGRLVFSTTRDGQASPTEAFRVDKDGAVLINATTKGGSEQFSLIGAPGFNMAHASTGTIGVFRTGGIAGSVVGSISVTASATAYNTSSDYRLKENVTPVTDGITRLQQLKPSRFNFIADPDKTVDGFIAHEVQTIVPEAITGEKDAVDDDGNPVYQGIDQSKLVPLLTAALQEAVAKIESLEARLTAAGI